MSEIKSEDIFSTVLTEIERLVVVWDDWTIAGVADSPIVLLIHKSTANLSLPACTLVSSFPSKPFHAC